MVTTFALNRPCCGSFNGKWQRASILRRSEKLTKSNLKYAESERIAAAETDCGIVDYLAARVADQRARHQSHALARALESAARASGATGSNRDAFWHAIRSAGTFDPSVFAVEFADRCFRRNAGFRGSGSIRLGKIQSRIQLERNGHLERKPLPGPHRALQLRSPPDLQRHLARHLWHRGCHR